jgi:carbamoyl-phosphate synthase large subunit
MNVLLTCAGRRNYLVEFFQQALGGRGQVLAADASPTAPALQQADRAFVVPLVDQPDYLDIIHAICQEHDVRLLISLNDLELPLLASQRDRFAAKGTLVAVSSPQVVEVCFDKWATHEFLRGNGIRAPLTYQSIDEARAALSRHELGYPVVIKPRWGTASIGIEYPEDDRELELAYELVQKRLRRTFLASIGSTDPEKCILIQEKLEGQEYGLDVVNDLDGQHVCTFVKRKLSMRAGETDRATTVLHEPLEQLGHTVGHRLGHIGILDCDIFVDGQDCILLEMNPRFGGGYPFSHVAGANIPAALTAWAEGREPDIHWLRVKPGVTASKYDLLAVIEQ